MMNDDKTQTAIYKVALSLFINLEPPADSGKVGRLIIESGKFKGTSAGKIMQVVWKASEYLYDECV